MGVIKTLLALIGAIVVAGLIFAFVKFGGMIGQVSKLDPGAMSAYMEMGQKVMATGDPSEGMLRRVKVDDDVSNDDILEAMKSIAGEENMQLVGDTTMFDGSVDENGKKTKYTRIISFCSRTIAKDFLDHSAGFGIFMPCRIMIREDDEGHRWLYTMALDLMIHGGHPLPPKLLAEATHVKETMYKLMDLPAKGDF